MTSRTPAFVVAAEVERALGLGLPLVALESTVITHGLPRPQNLALARDMEAEIRRHGAVPATVAVLEGSIHIGLREPELERLAQVENPIKVSRRDFALALARGASGGTTVAGTLFAAHRTGLRVFATGGIGGVHREGRYDVSSDLPALGETPMLVVCSGAKSILDLPATLEYLETLGVPVVGYGTEDFPAFYSVRSGLKAGLRLDTPQEVAEFARAHWDLGLRTAVLVVQPVPAEHAIPRKEIDPLIAQASLEARQQKIQGQALTPFLLERIRERTGGRSLRANLALLLNNADLAAQIARSMAAGLRQRAI
jgi:pseudouridylate synthase